MILNIGPYRRKKLPVLNSSYPADVTGRFGAVSAAVFRVEIALDGKPEVYSYQWYFDGNPVPGATGSSYTRTGVSTTGVHHVYCVVTNGAGSVKSREAVMTGVSAQEYSWTGSANMAFYYGDGSPQGETTLVGSHYEWNDTRYGQVLWFTTDSYGGTEFRFIWKPVAFTGDDAAVYCRISQVRADGCTNHSGNAVYMGDSGDGSYGCSGRFDFRPNTTYYIYVNRSDKSYGYHHYASEHSGWGSAGITVG